MNNIQPRSRKERESQKDRELIEKSRINQRNGHELRNVNTGDLLHRADPNSDLYCSENQRFDKDFAIYDKQIREQKRLQNESNLEQKRTVGLQREEYKWNLNNQASHYDDQKIQNHRDQLEIGKRNINGMPYNPITQNYHDSTKGQQLKEYDDSIRIQQILRTEVLDRKANTQFDILTGEPRNKIHVPQNLQQKYQEFKNQSDRPF